MPFAFAQASVKALVLHIVEPGHSFVEAMPYQAGSSAQRIRIGLTGLAAAFIIVMFASAISKSSQDNNTSGVTQAVSNEPNEPLAELGVAPGASTTNNSTAANRQ